VANAFTSLSKPQARVLAAFSLGIARAQHCTLARVAERLFWLGKADTVERRLQRFLSNPHLGLEAGCRSLATWVLSSPLFAGRTLVLLVDETSLGEHLKVMVVCLAYRGRAIPLAWWCYPQERYPMKQIQLIDTLLGWVAASVPAGCQVLVEADRGIGTSPGLLRRIQERGWRYLVRVQGSVRLRLPNAQIVLFRERVARAGQQWSGAVEAFRKAGWRRCWAMAYWGVGQREPWLLLSNWQQAQAPQYGWRMWEELAFRDLKSSGWHWQKSRVWDPEHANRLWLAMALGYAWTLSLGTQAAHEQVVRKQVTCGRQPRRSLFRLGLRVLQQAHQLYRQVRCFFELLFLPCEPEETVVQ
jgi:hypothetical protein